MRLAPLSVHPFVCPSVCPVRLNSKTKKRRKIKIGVDVPHSTSKWGANFHFEGSKFKVARDVKTKKNLASSLLTGGRRRLHTRPTPLLGLLYCRRLTPWSAGRTAAYNAARTSVVKKLRFDGVVVKRKRYVPCGRRCKYDGLTAVLLRIGWVGTFFIVLKRCDITIRQRYCFALYKPSTLPIPL